MRIDKFLWCTRYFKTRNQATEATKKGHIQINGTAAKPAKEVQIGDHISVRINQVNYELEVLGIPKSRVGAKLVDELRKDCTPEEALAHREMMRLSKKHYRKKGEGRPTKKDRRDIEGYLDDTE
ncbi:MAG: RNA-binding S4 domain-containing protein [Bacteroidia bacterium]|nr:RNA-binding S4 domain-containing protein [Bacteroidia bacterium]